MEKTVKVKDTPIQIPLPEGFFVMKDEDYIKMGRKPSDYDFAIRNVEKHFIYEVSWKKMPFFAKAFSIETIAKESEKRFCGCNPILKKENNVEYQIDGIKACGFTYHYEVSGISVMAEIVWIKYGAFSYGFNCMARKNAFEEDPKAFDNFIQKIQIEK